MTMFIFVWTKPSIFMLKCPGSPSVVLLLQQAIWSYQWHMFFKKFVVAAKKKTLNFPNGCFRSAPPGGAISQTVHSGHCAPSDWFLARFACWVCCGILSCHYLWDSLHSPNIFKLILSTWAPPCCLWRCESIPLAVILRQPQRSISRQLPYLSARIRCYHDITRSSL